MSGKFWINLLLALLALPLAVAVMHFYRQGVFREMRAKWLRRKIVVTMQALLPLINASLDEEPTALYYSMRLRGKLEHLLTRSDVLLAEEQTRLADFLTKFATLLAKSKAGFQSSEQVVDVLLLGQRVIRESRELGV